MKLEGEKFLYKKAWNLNFPDLNDFISSSRNKKITQKKIKISTTRYWRVGVKKAPQIITLAINIAPFRPRDCLHFGNYHHLNEIKLEFV